MLSSLNTPSHDSFYSYHALRIIRSCTGTFTLEDTASPVALCRDVTVELDAAGTASIMAGDVDDGSFDPCGIASLSVAPSSFSDSNVGVSNTAILTVTDVNDNSSTCSSTVTVVEDPSMPSGTWTMTTTS